MSELIMRIDDLRLRLHFARVTLWMKANSSQHESEKELAREKQIAELRHYATQGLFPRNHTHNTMRPSFIDRDDRLCAVAHLLIQSGYEDTAQMIVAQANEAYVPEMRFPELDVWAEQHGLTREELTVVQPAYPPTAEQIETFLHVTRALIIEGTGYLVLLGFLGLVGGLSVIRTLRDWNKIGQGTLFPQLSSIIGIALLGTSLWLSTRMLEVTLFNATTSIMVNTEMQQSFANAYTISSMVKQVWQPTLIVGALLFLLGNTTLFKIWLHRRREKTDVKLKAVLS